MMSIDCYTKQIFRNYLIGVRMEEARRERKERRVGGGDLLWLKLTTMYVNLVLIKVLN